MVHTHYTHTSQLCFAVHSGVKKKNGVCAVSVCSLLWIHKLNFCISDFVPLCGPFISLAGFMVALDPTVLTLVFSRGSVCLLYGLVCVHCCIVSVIVREWRCVSTVAVRVHFLFIKPDQFSMSYRIWCSDRQLQVPFCHYIWTKPVISTTTRRQ